MTTRQVRLRGSPLGRGARGLRSQPQKASIHTSIRASTFAWVIVARIYGLPGSGAIAHGHRPVPCSILAREAARLIWGNLCYKKHEEAREAMREAARLIEKSLLQEAPRGGGT